MALVMSRVLVRPEPGTSQTQAEHFTTDYT